ncbi:MAG: FAD binding domain-containing protein [Thermomicrobiales bacterium]
MHLCSYERGQDAAAVVAALQTDDAVALLAGGTTLIDLMKLGVMAPARLIDITGLARVDPALEAITETPDGGVAIGALAKMADVAAHPLIATRYAFVAESLRKGASAQLRNMATIGGNLLQRTRCVYFRDVTIAECNKRQPGSGCAARVGIHRQGALLGASADCIALHPSDVAVALVALEVVVQIRGARGDRQVAIGDFFLPPGDTPWRETVVAHDDLIIRVDLPPLPDGVRSHYLKVRDRESYEFALTSAAVAIQVTDGRISWARIGIGGVATVPWRARDAELELVGQVPSVALFATASAAALAGAEPLTQNAFKIPLARRTIERALATVTGIDAEER